MRGIPYGPRPEPPTPGDYKDLDILLANGQTVSYSLLDGRDEARTSETAMFIIKRDKDQAVVERTLVNMINVLTVTERKRTVKAPEPKPTLITSDGVQVQ